MKSQSKESGSIVHIVVIVILVAAVLGLLGFVFWQNLMDKPADTQSSTQQTSTGTKEPASVDSTDANTLSISEWSVKGNLGKSLAVNYVIQNSNQLNLTTDEVDCGSGLNGTGYIVQLSGSDKGPGVFGDETAAETYDVTLETNARIGDYYYFFVAPSGVCEVDGVDYTETTAKELKDATLSLVKTLK
jgi:hypothetical protein